MIGGVDAAPSGDAEGPGLGLRPNRDDSVWMACSLAGTRSVQRRFPVQELDDFVASLEERTTCSGRFARRDVGADEPA